MIASVFFQRGYGWYRLSDHQYGLDGLLMGTMLTYSTPHANYGVHINEFRREHTSDAIGGPRDYFNYGTKGEANAFAKFTWNTDRWLLYSDNQVRTTRFQYHGEVAIDPIRWTFFNPKVGVRHGRFYFSAGVSRREPTRRRSIHTALLCRREKARQPYTRGPAQARARRSAGRITGRPRRLSRTPSAG